MAALCEDESCGLARVTSDDRIVRAISGMWQAENGDVENGADQRDVVGIPEDNPNHQPDDGDDECEKGETAVKTTPSGKQVNVPCHAVEPGHPGFSQGQDDGDEIEDDDSDLD